MAEPWTLAQAQEHLAEWLAAESACASGQSYTIGTRHLERADMLRIAERISYWRREIARLDAGRVAGPRVMRFVPRDL